MLEVFKMKIAKRFLIIAVTIVANHIAASDNFERVPAPEQLKREHILSQTNFYNAQAHTLLKQVEREEAKTNRTFFQKLQEPAVLIQGAGLLLTTVQVLPPLIKAYYGNPNEKAMTDITIRTAEFKLQQMEKEAARKEVMENMAMKQFMLNLKKEARKLQAIERIDELHEKQRNGQTLSEDEEQELAHQRDVIRALAEQNLPATA